MVQLLFNTILTILSYLIRIIVFPINALMVSTLPNLSGKLVEISNNLETLFTSVVWALGVVPPIVIATLVFIIGVEIARYTIYISSHIITLIVNLIQKIKFW